MLILIQQRVDFLSALYWLHLPQCSMWTGRDVTRAGCGWVRTISIFGSSAARLGNRAQRPIHETHAALYALHKGPNQQSILAQLVSQWTSLFFAHGFGVTGASTLCEAVPHTPQIFHAAFGHRHKAKFPLLWNGVMSHTYPAAVLFRSSAWCFNMIVTCTRNGVWLDLELVNLFPCYFQACHSTQKGMYMYLKCSSLIS